MVDQIILNGEEQRLEGYTVHVEKVRVPPERRRFSKIFLTEETEKYQENIQSEEFLRVRKIRNHLLYIFIHYFL